jgi:hypothetical protein
MVYEIRNTRISPKSIFRAVGVVLLLSILLARGFPSLLQAAQPTNGGGATPVVPTECGTPSTWSAQPIINVRMSVTNDEDSGFDGYWALDNYQKSIYVWQMPPTGPAATFCALVQYSGLWQTFAGAISPASQPTNPPGVTQPSDGNGPMSGGYVSGPFTGVYNPTKPTSGFIGSFDCGGTKADILKGYSNLQTGNPHCPDWTTFYFTGGATFPEPTWGWIYTQGDGVGYGNLWANIASGSFGDIVTSQGCQEGDGNGDFQGNHGNGNFAMDSDSCKDGDSDSVQMSNRGDGQSFQSTSINSMSFDPLTNTQTITGVGTTNGVPVTFTFLAIESGPTSPGWVSFISSDGYSNAGPLTNGSIVLH